MNNLQCQSQNHQSKEITTACFDTNCRNMRLCCLLCLAETHKNHLKKLVEVKQLTKFIEQESQKQKAYPEYLSFGQKQLIQDLEKLLALIDNLQKTIKEQIETLKQQNLQDYLKSVTNNQQGAEYSNQFLECMLQYVEVDNCNISLKPSNTINEFEERQIKIFKQSEQYLQKAIDQINSSKLNIGRLCFNEHRKHVDISIIDQSKIQKNQGTSYAMAFANQGFDPRNQSYAFAINIQKIQDLWIGVGNDESIAPTYLFLNHRPSWKLGHYQYMISNNNCTYHHADAEINHKKNGITFKMGDTIQIKYDHNIKVIEFKKQSEQSTTVKMPVTDMTKILYPCVMFYCRDQQVQIVEYQ